MKVEIKFDSDAMEALAREHVGRIVQLDRFPSVEVKVSYGTYTVVLKDQVEVDSDAANEERLNKYVRERDAEQAAAKAAKVEQAEVDDALAGV